MYNWMDKRVQLGGAQLDEQKCTFGRSKVNSGKFTFNEYGDKATSIQQLTNIILYNVRVPLSLPCAFF